MYRINLFENLKSPSNPITITTENYIDWVTNGHNRERVLKARLYGKGTALYKREKENSPCVTFNFLFNEYKNDENITQSTGLLYYDMDSEDALKIIPKIDKNNIHILHKSIGGIGYSLVVKATGITTTNFNESYIQIAQNIGIQDVFDNNALKKSQFTVLSYDTNLYYNPNSIIFSAAETKKVSFGGNMYSSSPNLLRNDTFSYNKYNYRYTNASDYVDSNLEYQVFPDGIDVAKIDIPRNVKVGNRKNVLISIVNQMVIINPHLSKEDVLDKACNLNKIITDSPLEHHEVVGVVNSVFKYKMNGTLKPINNKKRKVIFNENSKLTKHEKITISNQEIGKLRTELTKKKIHEAILNWDSKERLTAKLVAKRIQMGVSTVKRYWPEYQELIKYQNQELKSRNS